MQRARKYVDLFMGWFTVQHLVELINFTVMMLAMTAVCCLFVAGYVNQVTMVIGCTGGGALAGATAMWLLNMGRLDDVEYERQRKDEAVSAAASEVEHAEHMLEAAAFLANTPSDPMPAITELYVAELPVAE